MRNPRGYPKPLKVSIFSLPRGCVIKAVMDRRDSLTQIWPLALRYMIAQVH
jgi:hypothetical protein